MKRIEQTIVSVLTPTGRGAVAVIVVEGPMALEIVDRFFRIKSGRLADRAVNRIAYGRWGAEPAEDVVACRRGPASIEIHCHGGVAAVNRIVGDLVAVGAVEVAWQQRIAEQEGSSIRAEARIALSKAVTERTALILLDQYHGTLEATLTGIVEKLTDGQSELAGKLIDQLLSRAPLGLHLTAPWRVVIAGPPNVGKSSLINALVGYQRAIVFDQPGTTRDVVTAQTAFDGWPVQLADTAGLRASDDPLESAGIERAVAETAAADCLVLVFDASQPWTLENDRLVEDWPAALVVQNKCDLAAPSAGGLVTSALSGAGIEQLIHAIVARLVPAVPPSGAAVPFTAAQVEALQTAAEQIGSGNTALAKAALEAMIGDGFQSWCSLRDKV